jgi:ubiquinone/menaquinone biosynthesis C-methylase UbiE
MPKIEPFESFSKVYDEWFERNPQKYKLELKAVKTFIPQNAKGLEVGVGSGKFAAPLGIKTGVEPSNKMAQIAESLGINVIKAIAEALPFEDESFDFVLMVTTICFVDDIKKSFKEAHRVLKKDGFIVVGFVDKDSELGNKYQKNRDKSKFYKEATFFSTSEVVDLLKDAGFKSFEIKQTLLPQDEKKDIIDGFGKGSFVVIKGIK